MGLLTMGRYSYNAPVRRGDMNTITIGSFTCLGALVVCDSGFNHNRKFVSTFPFSVVFNECRHLEGHPLKPGDIIIGSDCWVGENSLIMGGVTIHSGSIVGARSIVTKNIPPYEVWAGSPAKFIRKRFTDEQIEKLLEITWWNWELSKVIENTHLIMSENIDEFIARHYEK